jgi:DNA-binding NtrC family response regulator
LSPSALAEATQYPWPGNVRELFNCVARSVALAPGDRIEQLGLAQASTPSVSAPTSRPVATTSVDRPLKEHVAEIVAVAEKSYLVALLEQTGGSLTEAARLAGIDRKSIYNKMKAYGLSKEEFKQTGHSEES